MKPISISLFALLMLLVNSAFGGSYEYQRLQKEIEPYLATKRPYPVPSEIRLASAPGGCQLIHVNHLGRHGSRQVTSAKDFLSDYIHPAIKLGLLTGFGPQHLVPADNVQLTPSGRLLAERLSTLNKHVQQGRFVAASLTQQGVQELEDLGRRLFNNTGLSPVEIKKQISLRSLYAQSTSKIRTQDSRKAFLNGLASSLEVSPESLRTILVTPAPLETDRTLHFYDHCKNYLTSKKAIKKASKKHLARLQDEEKYLKANREIARTFMTALDDQQSAELSNLVYSLCQLDANLSYTLGVCPLLLKANSSFASYLKAKSHLANVKQFYKRGLPPELNGLNRDMAVDLMHDFLISSQAAIDNPLTHPIATLRFAHDSTLLRMMEMLDLVTLSNSVDVFGEVTWDVGKLAPMAANILWQTYQCPAPFNDNEPVYLVRMLHNERVKNFPIGQCKEGDGFCNWDNVREYYQERTSNLVLEDVCGELIIPDDSDD